MYVPYAKFVKKLGITKNLTLAHKILLAHAESESGGYLKLVPGR
jgi:hypothetical protein